MESVLPFLIVAAALATLAILATGIVAMIRGGEFNRKHGNRLMRWRVLMQGLAIALLGLLMLLSQR